MTLYEDLGLGKEASEEDIKQAYRKKARETHPDKGGSAEKFQIVSNAYTILSDAERRRRYDQTGEAGQFVDEKAMVMQHLGALLFSVIESTPDLDHIDLIAKMKQIINEGRDKADREVAATKKKIVQYKSAQKRFKHKGKKKNRLADMIEHSIKGQEGKLEEIAKIRKLGDDMEKIAEEYVYEADAVYPKAEDALRNSFFHDLPDWPKY